MTTARFEYRVFNTVLKDEQKRLVALSGPVPSQLRRRTSREHYLIPLKHNRFNAKIRDKKIDIKYLLKTVDVCEQWQPLLKIDFPLEVKNLKNDVFPALGLDPEKLDTNRLSLHQFFDLLKTEPAIRVVEVKKIRRTYTIQTVLCEFASLTIGDKRMATISVEANDVQQLKKIIKEIGIDKYKNTNYIQAIRNILGM